MGADKRNCKQDSRQDKPKEGSSQEQPKEGSRKDGG